MTDTQKQQFDQYIDQWQSWHIQTELPMYLAHLDELADDVASQNINIDRMNYHQQKARDHWHRLRAYIAPGIAQMATTLDEEQVTYLFAALEKENVNDEKEWLEGLERSDKERKDDWIERNVDNLDERLGRLSNEQKVFIENSYGNFASSSQYWIDYKRTYQNALRKEFASPARGDDFTSRIIELIVNPEIFRSKEMLAANANNERETKFFLLTLFSLSTEKQRQHLIEEINDLRDDIAELAN
jgi:hypothetical protein